MTWLALLRALLSLADTVAGYLREGQMLEAGQALAQSKNLTRALDAIRDAQRARDVIDDHLARDPTFMPDNDPNRRD